MDWKRALAYVTGSVDEHLLARNTYLVEENRILRAKLPGRLRMTDPERKCLAVAARDLGRRALKEIATIVTPDTLLRWHRNLVARKFDSSKVPRTPGRPRTPEEIEKLVLRFARENRTWGYNRIMGALKNLGIDVCDQTVGNILKRHGLDPAPERRKCTSWSEFIRSHRATLAATDFFTAEVWTPRGLMTHYVLFFIATGSRIVHIAGITPYPDEEWMKQIARNVTMPDWGFLSGMKYLIHDRDSKFSAAFREILKSAGVESAMLPFRSPNLNAFSERWVRSVKEECLSKLILFGEGSLQKALDEYLIHYLAERNHQGLGNQLLVPSAADRVGAHDGPVSCRERLGGLLNFYHRRTG